MRAASNAAISTVFAPLAGSSVSARVVKPARGCPTSATSWTNMITFFNISGCMIYLDQDNKQIGFEDVFTKIDMCRAHYAENGLGRDYVDQFVR